MAKVVLLITTLTITYRYTVVGDAVDSQKELGNYIETRNYRKYMNSSKERIYSNFVIPNNSLVNNEQLNNEMYQTPSNKLKGNHILNTGFETNYKKLNLNDGNVTNDYLSGKGFLTKNIESENTNASNSKGERSLNKKVMNDSTIENIINSVSQSPLANENDAHNKILARTIRTRQDVQRSENFNTEKLTASDQVESTQPDYKNLKHETNTKRNGNVFLKLLKNITLDSNNAVSNLSIAPNIDSRKTNFTLKKSDTEIRNPDILLQRKINEKKEWRNDEKEQQRLKPLMIKRSRLEMTNVSKSNKTDGINVNLTSNLSENNNLKLTPITTMQTSTENNNVSNIHQLKDYVSRISKFTTC